MKPQIESIGARRTPGASRRVTAHHSGQQPSAVRVHVYTHTHMQRRAGGRITRRGLRGGGGRVRERLRHIATEEEGIDGKD